MAREEHDTAGEALVCEPLEDAHPVRRVATEVDVKDRELARERLVAMGLDITQRSGGNDVMYAEAPEGVAHHVAEIVVVIHEEHGIKHRSKSTAGHSVCPARLRVAMRAFAH
jgi:hypothetical protein